VKCVTGSLGNLSNGLLYVFVFLFLQIASRHIEYYLHWCWNLLQTHGAVLTSILNSMAHLESIRSLIRAISMHEREIMKMSDENYFSLTYLTSQMVERSPSDASESDASLSMEVEAVVAPVVVETQSGNSSQKKNKNQQQQEQPQHAQQKEEEVVVAVMSPVNPTSPTGEAADAEAASAKKKKSAKKAKLSTPQKEGDKSAAADVAVSTSTPAASLSSSSSYSSSSAKKSPKSTAKPTIQIPELHTPVSALPDTEDGEVSTSHNSNNTSSNGADIDVLDTQSKRVTFSKQLSAVKFISPRDKPGTYSALGSSSSGKKNKKVKHDKSPSEKKRLWAEED
jgi:hypothetical protein